ncbi:MAG: PD40 domain-containing protein [candidate division Zixibacteria bacterium]|nr:PD40 domain-containing protein [candidate division Zixibacteria bacterium]
MKLLSMILAPIIIAMACSSQEQKPESKEHPELPDRMAITFKNIAEIAIVKQLTDQKSDMSPFFSRDGKRIYFTRLLSPSSDDTSNMRQYAQDEYFSIDYQNDKMYFHDSLPEKPKPDIISEIPLPSMTTEWPLIAYKKSKAIYFCTQSKSDKRHLNIYKLMDDSLAQISYGSRPAFLQTVSDDEHYLAFLYGKNLSRLIIMDLYSGRFYEIPKGKDESNQFDYEASFSSDSKHLLFLRSGDLHTKNDVPYGDVPYGDIWLVEFYGDSMQ